MCLKMFWDWSDAKECTSCRSRKMLKNACSPANRGLDTTENVFCEVCPLSVYRSLRSTLSLLNIPLRSWDGRDRRKKLRKFRADRPPQISEARSRLYQRRSLQVNNHFSAFFKIYKIFTILPRSNLKKLQIFVKKVVVLIFFTKCCKF